MKQITSLLLAATFAFTLIGCQSGGQCPLRKKTATCPKTTQQCGDKCKMKCGDKCKEMCGTKCS